MLQSEQAYPVSKLEFCSQMSILFFLEMKKIWQTSSNLQSQPIQRVTRRKSYLCYYSPLQSSDEHTEYPQEHLVWAGSCAVTRI